MICTKCGARLMENDQFCPKCGARVIKEKRCPDCGAVLRDGIKFCPECGRPVGGKRKAPVVSDETLDIPIEAIERNILSETAAEIKGRRSESSPRRSVSSEREPARRSASGGASEKRSSSGSGTSKRAPVKKTADRETDSERGYSGSTSGRKKQSSVPAPPPRKKKPVYREEEWEDDENWEDDDDWDEDEDDWEDDDWDDEGIDVITIMTVVIGCVLLIVVAFLGYRLYRQYVPKNYGKAVEEQEQKEQQEQGEEQKQDSQGEEEGNGEEQVTGTEEANEQDTNTLTIDSRVNVRAEPNTSSDILKVAQAGETYACHGTAGDGTWYEIVLEDGMTGYVFQDYVSVE